MTDMIRCPSCRGAKKVPKLGGMIGECNTCKGKGNIPESDRPIKVVAESLPFTHELIRATAEAIPLSADKFVVEVLEPPVLSSEAKAELYKKSAVFKRKKG